MTWELYAGARSPGAVGATHYAPFLHLVEFPFSLHQHVWGQLACVCIKGWSGGEDVVKYLVLWYGSGLGYVELSFSVLEPHL